VDLRQSALEVPGAPAPQGYVPPPLDLSHLNRRPDGLEAMGQLPSAFDWRDSGKVSRVKSQAGCGTCWDFGTTSVLESAVLMGEGVEYDFSEQSVALCVDPSWVYYYDGEEDPCAAGGWSWLASESFIRKGAVLESCHPYEPSALRCDGACPGCDACPAVKRVNGYRFVTGEQGATELIKQAVYTHGPTTMAFLWSSEHVYSDTTPYGTVYDYAGCAEEVGYANHLVSIIGWDDEVPHYETPGEGAWLVKNSWGTDWGNAGYFWLAYDSSCMTEVAYLTYEDTDAGAELLYWDEAGFVGSHGYEDTSAWMTNVFTSPRDSTLTHVEFWTTDHNTEYAITVYRDGDPRDGLGNPATSQTGTCAEAGYYSIALDDPVGLPAGQPFAIAAMMTTEVYTGPIAIEEAAVIPNPPTGVRAAGAGSDPDVMPPIQRGVSFARHWAGDPWTDLADEGRNACLRARTKGYDSDTLIPPGSTWKYLDDGSDQGSAWTASDFDDGFWSSGPAELGYGDGDEVTEVGYGPNPEDKYITTYFRHTFTVDDASTVGGLRLRLLRDDGAVVTLNGAEVFRSNMPGGAIGNQTLASTCVGGSDEETFWEVSIGAEHLVSGSNVIAVEVHQCDPGSSDISFDLELSRSAARPVDVSLHDEEACVASGKAVRLTTQWYVDVAAYADDWLDALDLTVEVDGAALSDVADHWGAIEPCGDIDEDGDTDYVTRWANVIGSLADGAHAVDSHFSLAYPVTDGFDFDGDGEPDAFSGSWDASVSLQVGGCVLFDEAHEEANTLSWERAQSIEPEHPDWVYFGALADALSDEFTLVRNPDEPLTAELLAGYDALMLSVPQEELTPDELAAVEGFMQGGGGVLALSNWAAWVINPLTEEKGITCDHRSIFEFGGEGDFVVEDFADHPAVEGVAAMVTNWSSSLEATSPAVGLAFTEEDVFRDLDGDDSYDAGEPTGPFTVAAAYESGAGRLAVVADNPFQDHGFEDRNNAPLARALLRWLMGREAFGAQITKSVTPVGQVSYGDALTYTVVISAAPGTEMALYDPLLGTTFDRFLVQPQGVEHAGDSITGTVAVTSTSQTTVSFVVGVAVPTVAGLTVSVTNEACVYPTDWTLDDCLWSDPVANDAFRPSDSDTLIPAGATWKYLDDGSDQGTAWTEPGFDDGGWPSGPAELGYGDGDEATVVSYGPDAEDKQITTYFRRAFTVTAPSALRLRLLRDDGAVAYLNGAEVFRTNVPTGTIGCQTLASTCLGGADEETFHEITVSADLVERGRNVLAVEIHQCDPGSSDISFDLELSRAGPLYPSLPRFSRPELLAEVPSEGHPNSLIVEDLTQDGYPDVFAVPAEHFGAEELSPVVLVNDGSGGFVEATSSVFSGTVPGFSVAREIVVADFNGDTHPDLFVADHGYDAEPFPGHRNALILSAPGGKLVDATATLPQQSDFTHSADAADIDGDGDLDLFLGNVGGHEERIPPQLWLNGGSGGFTRGEEERLPEAQTDPTQNAYGASLFADVNGDDAPDLILGTAGPNCAGQEYSVVLLNDGQGWFSLLPGAVPPHLWPPTDYNHVLDIQATDLNGDQHLDLVFHLTHFSDPYEYVGSYMQILMGNGDGTFRDETDTRLPQEENDESAFCFLQFIDLDYDGDLDLVTAIWMQDDTGLFYINDGRGIFTPWEQPLALSPFDFGDIDGDGRRDLLVALDRWDEVPTRYFAMRSVRSGGCPAVFLPLVVKAGEPSEPVVDGIVHVYPVWGSMWGKGWPVHETLSVDLRNSTGALKDTTFATADSQGELTVPFHHPFGFPAEGDRITLIPADGAQATFPVKLPTASADAGANTIVGIAEPGVRVEAQVIRPGDGSHALETVAAGDGTFSFDFTPFFDWEGGDLLRVWQWVTDYAAIVITEESPEMTVVPGP
jgi:C1A family cysteine protease